MRKVVLSSVGLIAFLITVTTVAVLLASGYRLNRENGKTFVEGTGVMVFTSRPDGARVYVNDHLTTATDNTINLQPGDYEVRIEKDGYFAWNKKITVKQGEVSQADALLFPNTPKLDPLTTTGATNATVDDTNTLIAYVVSSAQPRKNGVYLMNMSSRAILPIGGLSSQLTDNTVVDFTNAQLSFSPDGDQLLASISGELSTAYYLLSTNSFNETPQDVTNVILQVQAEWEEDRLTEKSRQVRTLDNKLRPLVNRYFSDPKFSPENDKILYTASGSASLGLIKNPPIKGANSTPQTRDINDGNMYVYDIKEDRNYALWEANNPAATLSAKPNFIWHPNSRHLLYLDNGQIKIMEFDGQNKTTLYAQTFAENFVTIWPDGSNLAILTNLNIPENPYNLYKIGLK